jgi:hypothetical protein
MPELNVIKTQIEVNGKKYNLQHPGNREWLKLKQSIYTVNVDQVAEVNMTLMLDYFFEHCLYPVEGQKLTLDNVPLKELEEVWGSVAPRFLRGDLAAGYRYPIKK